MNLNKNTKPLRILHTSDWHLGQLFYNQKREEEHKHFLNWLINIIIDYKVDILIICGDVFDIAFPPNYAFECLYNFLAECSKTNCHQVIIIAGNHDSPATLNAPKEILKLINVSVFSNIKIQNFSYNVLVVKDKFTSIPLAIIIAIPFIREKDIYSPKPDESLQERETAVLKAIQDLYNRTIEEALKIQSSINLSLPIIATGHLFLELSNNYKLFSERLLYGYYNASIPISFFSPYINYVALGHLHSYYIVTPNENQIICYSGSPIPLSFDEISNQKYVVLIELDPRNNSNIAPHITPISVPQFQPMYSLTGNCETLSNEILRISTEAIKSSNSYITPWLKVTLQNEENPDLAFEKLINLANAKNIKILHFETQHKQMVNENTTNFNYFYEIASKTSLSPEEVFKMRLEQEENLSKDTKNKLISSYSDILAEIYQQLASNENLAT